MEKLTKQEMINRLISDHLDTVFNHAYEEDGRLWVKELFLNGFAGYKKSTKAELEHELKSLGLLD